MGAGATPEEERAFAAGMQRAAAIARRYKRKWPKDIFPPDGESVEARASEMARRACDLVAAAIEDLCEVLVDRTGGGE
jgi:hypothetical protein